MDYQHTRKWSIIGLCTGAVAGLATITPGSGLVSQSSSLAFGALGSIFCNIILRYKHRLGFDDALDVFAVHYIGGLVGLVLTGIFAERWVIALGYPEGTPLEEIPIGGWLDGNWMQVPIQLAAIASVSAWSFVVTYLILIVLNKIPSLTLRLKDEDEIIGTDWAEMGERAYGYLPMDEEHARLQQMIDDAKARSEEEEDDDTLSANSGGEVQMDEHVTRAGPIDLSLNTETIAGRKKGLKHSLRQFMMSRKDKNIAIKGVSHILEEPVIFNYAQNNNILKALDGTNFEQKKPVRAIPNNLVEMDDMTDQRNYHYSSTEEAGPSTTASSGRNTPVHEYEYSDKVLSHNNKTHKQL